MASSSSVGTMSTLTLDSGKQHNFFWAGLLQCRLKLSWTWGHSPDDQTVGGHELTAIVALNTIWSGNLCPDLNISLAGQGKECHVRVFHGPAINNGDGRLRGRPGFRGRQFPGIQPVHLDLGCASVVARPDCEGQVKTTAG